jgi:MoxR-like ATPase
VVAAGEDIAAVHALVREIPAASNVVDYASRLVRATRPGSAEAASVVSRYVRWGAGPRAGQSLLLCGKARALLEGRATVALDDVQALALPVLRHRVLVNFQAEAEGLDADAIVARLLSEVPTRT